MLAALYGFYDFAAAEEISRAVDEKYLKDYLHRMSNFDKPQPDDIILSKKEMRLLKSSLNRLRRVQRTVGFGNFSVLSFDDAVKYSRNYSSIGRFTKQELDFLDKTFHLSLSLRLAEDRSPKS